MIICLVVLKLLCNVHEGVTVTQCDPPSCSGVVFRDWCSYT